MPGKRKVASNFKKHQGEKECISTQEATESCDSQDLFFEMLASPLPDLLSYNHATNPKIVDTMCDHDFTRTTKPKYKKRKTEVITGRFIPNRKETNLKSLPFIEARRHRKY